MSLPYITKHIKIRALHDDVIVTDMNFGEMVTSGGIVVQSDDAKVHGIKPRWGRVYCVGPEQTEIKVGQWILIEHGRWTRAVKIDDGEGEKNIHKVDVDCVLAWSDEKPTDFYIGNEVSNGDSFTIRPEEFGAR
jgi:co-chaperonin GroES (HSP10)